MVKPKTEEEIELLRENAIIVSKTLAEVGKRVAPGVTTLELNRVADEFIRDNGAIPSFLGYDGFPAALCMSVNDVVVHGFPSDYVLKEGDIVSVDCGTLYKGYNGDSAYTFPVGEVDAGTRKLLDVTKASLYKGIEAGHGLGREMHEEPGVPNYGRRGKGTHLVEGMVICIEPMINAGGRGVYLARNGWAVHTSDHRKSAHYELTVVVRKGRAEQLSTYDFIEKDGTINF